MPVLINYQVGLEYQSLPGLGLQPAVEVHLYLGDRDTRVVGILDSGSAWTVFSEEIATRLGIDNVADGPPVSVTTFGGPSTFYQFDLEMAVEIEGIQNRFPAQVAFRQGHISRNILGRSVFFPRFQIGFRDRIQELYLSLEPGP